MTPSILHLLENLSERCDVRRVVYGLSAKRLYALTSEETTEAISLSCREVFERGRWKIEVIGPLLEKEAEKVHEGFWV